MSYRSNIFLLQQLTSSRLFWVAEMEAHLHYLLGPLADVSLSHLVKFSLESLDLGLVGTLLVVIPGILKLSLLGGMIIEQCKGPTLPH